MACILITSGPTRQYLDPVRYLTNASSGRMGSALAAAAIRAGHEVVIVSGPVEIEYPAPAKIVPVLSTEEMLAACQDLFPRCDGLIGVAAPCDYRPVRVAPHKISKTGGPLLLELIETPDILATLSGMKNHRWMVAFALETENERARAVEKLHRKQCDLIIVNGPAAIQGLDTKVEVIDPQGTVLASLSGSKEKVADGIFAIIEQRLIHDSRRKVSSGTAQNRNSA
jgi:phosphopantothenoylcysteine decarboxylase/phosphopantothenate--cysteine ligase